MSRSARIGIAVLLASASACARSALPEIPSGVTRQAAGSAAPTTASVVPEAGCTPCGEGLSPQKALRCLCSSLHCAIDLEHALSDRSNDAAFGSGCGHAWFVERIGHTYDLFIYQRRSGQLVYIQHGGTEPGVTCEDGTQTILLEAGEAPRCDEQDMDWCKFAHAESPIALGELDSARTCDENAVR
ncbi:MAG TPA: hypothetical protein VJV78_15405 [Polyangiales bacterium]|nr:hypothetical protein [Polyangiales bacterium]